MANKKRYYVFCAQAVNGYTVGRSGQGLTWREVAREAHHAMIKDQTVISVHVYEWRPES